MIRPSRIDAEIMLREQVAVPRQWSAGADDLGRGHRIGPMMDLPGEESPVGRGGIQEIALY